HLLRASLQAGIAGPRNAHAPRSVLFPTYVSRGGQSGETEQKLTGDRNHDSTRSRALGKQLHRINSRPPEGILILAIATVFFAGMAVAGFRFAYSDQPPLRLAANDIAASQPATPTTR